MAPQHPTMTGHIGTAGLRLRKSEPNKMWQPKTQARQRRLGAVSARMKNYVLENVKLNIYQRMQAGGELRYRNKEKEPVFVDAQVNETPSRQSNEASMSEQKLPSTSVRTGEGVDENQG